MAQKELQIVTLEQAKRLKAAGFDCETEHTFDGDKNLFSCYCDMIEDAPIDGNNEEGSCGLSAPTVALALKGFRDVKEYVYDISIRFFIRINTFKGSTALAVLNIQRTDTVKWSECGQHDTYEKAESALLDALLTELEGEQCSGK